MKHRRNDNNIFNSITWGCLCDWWLRSGHVHLCYRCQNRIIIIHFYNVTWGRMCDWWLRSGHVHLCCRCQNRIIIQFYIITWGRLCDWWLRSGHAHLCYRCPAKAYRRYIKKVKKIRIKKGLRVFMSAARMIGKGLDCKVRRHFLLGVWESCVG